MTRRRLTPSQKAQILERQAWTCGCGCGADLTGKRIDFDHMLCLALGGCDVPENIQALLYECHKAKTALDVRRIRKADRQRKHHETGRSRARKGPAMRSRGFDKRFSRRMDGSVVERANG